jgi:hypothetical protein
MSTTTYDIASAARVETPTAATAQKRGGLKGLLARAFARIVEARQRQAMEEIRRYLPLLPRELERVGWKNSERSEDSLPFVR